MFSKTEACEEFDENHATESKWRIAVDRVGDGMWELDLKTGKMSFSDKWQDIFGYSNDDLLNDITLWGQKIHPDDYAISVKKFEDIFTGVTSDYCCEVRYQCKDGGYKWILSRGVVASRNEKGEPLNMIGTHQDIQERKLAEEAQKVNNRKLEITRIKLEDKVKRLEELNYLIAHNMRGPASNIKMLAEVLQGIEDGTNDDPPFTRPQAIGMIRDVNSAFLQNLNILLEAAQVSLNRDIVFETIDIQGMVADISNQLSAEVFEKKAVITTDISVSELVYPRAYFSSILYNLLSNSLKYNRPGVTPTIDISVTRIGGQVVLSVKDNALGIDLEKYGNKIFKLKEVFHAGFDSKGVGLYMTKAQIESLGGRITVESTPNEGSLFTVYFAVKE